jgi:hypothetical protein
VLELGDYRVVELDLRLAEEEITSLRQLQAPVLELLENPEIDAAERRVPVLEWRVSPEHDEATRKRRVEMRIASAGLPEASGGLRLELAVEVSDPSGAWRIPKRFVEERYDETSVMTTEGRVIVTVLRHEDAAVIVLGRGLDENTVVVAPR